MAWIVLRTHQGRKGQVCHDGKHQCPLMSEHFHQVQLHFKTSKHASLSTWLDILGELLSATVRTRLKTSPLPSDSVHNELCSANTISCIKHCSSIDDIASHPLWTQWNICFLAFSFYCSLMLHLCIKLSPTCVWWLGSSWPSFWHTHSVIVLPMAISLIIIKSIALCDLCWHYI